MGLYSRHVFPRLCDWSMRNPRMARLRREVLSEVDGEILEIGFGTGLNLEHYPEHVRHLTAIDPGVGMARIARRRIERSRDRRGPSRPDRRGTAVRGRAVRLRGEHLDAVQHPGCRRAVTEIGRVLKPGGRFLFLEHGLSEEPGVQRWQRRLTPLQKRIAGGCRLDVDIEALVRSGAFRDVRVERFLLDRTPRIVGSMYRGVAVK